MNEKQEIRAWALAIALSVAKPQEVKATTDGSLSLPNEFWTLIKAVKKYISDPA